MKSITQINLARLTVRKSLSKTDSAQLQPPPLITIGGAISHIPCSQTHTSTLTFLRQRRGNTYNSTKHSAATVFFSNRLGCEESADGLKMKCKLPSLALLHHIWPRYFLKIFMCVSSQLKWTPGSSIARRSSRYTFQNKTQLSCRRNEDISVVMWESRRKEQSTVGIQEESFPGRKHKYSCRHEVKEGSPLR